MISSKVIVMEVKPPKLEYPVILQNVNSKLIVLFINENTGTVLDSGFVKGVYTGKYQEHLTDATDPNWAIFTDKITLSNMEM